MANIAKRGNGFRFTVSCGYDMNGKQVRMTKTWTPPPNMSGKRAAKEAERQFFLFEEQCRRGKVYPSNIKMSDFIERWLKEYAEQELKRTTCHTYKSLLPRVIIAFGNLSLEKISAGHITAFLANLSEEGVRMDTTYHTTVELKKMLGVSQKTFATNAGISKSTLENALAGKNVNKTSAEKIAKALHKTVEAIFEPVSRGCLSSKTRRHYYGLLRTILSTAVRWQVIPSNPCALVKPPHVEEQEIICLDERDAVSLINYATHEPFPRRALVLFLLYSGLRRAEVCGLRWSDLDLEHGVISIHQETVYVSGFGIYDSTPKTKKSKRTFPLSDSCVKIMKEYKHWYEEEKFRLGDEWHDTNRVFTKWNGEAVNPDSLSAIFKRIVERSGVLPITMHGARHTNATLMIATGTDIRTVADRLGHSQPSTTQNVYVHAIKSANRAAAERLDQILNPSSIPDNVIPINGDSETRSKHDFRQGV